MNTEQILDIIREKCELKKLTFGCEVINKHGDIEKLIRSKPFGKSGESRLLLVRGDEPFVPRSSKNVKILGLEPQLNHLLLLTNNSVLKYYDLKKSVRQNLEDNIKLREFVSSIIS